jgi:hypothetical protein
MLCKSLSMAFESARHPMTSRKASMSMTKYFHFHLVVIALQSVMFYFQHLLFDCFGVWMRKIIHKRVNLLKKFPRWFCGFKNFRFFFVFWLSLK